MDDYFHSANFEYFESGTYSLRTIAEEDEEELSREREEEENSKRKNPRMERKSSSDGFLTPKNLFQPNFRAKKENLKCESSRIDVK